MGKDFILLTTHLNERRYPKYVKNFKNWIGLMPSSRQQPAQKELKASLEALCLTRFCQIFVLYTQVLGADIMASGSVFLLDSCVCACVCLCPFVLLRLFPLTPFLFWFVLLHSLNAWLFSKGRQKGWGCGKEGRWERGNCNQNILDENKTYFQ